MISLPASTPYAWPYDGEVDPGRVALVICGAIGTWAARSPEVGAVEATLDLLRAESRRAGIAVVLVAQDDPVPPTARALQPAPDLRPVAGEEVVVAAGVDGFYGSPLDAVLTRAGRSHLLLAGRGFETTVHSTLRRANDRGYECLTLADACAVLDPELRAASISSIEMSGGIFGAVASASAVLASLSPLADKPPNNRQE